MNSLLKQIIIFFLLMIFSTNIVDLGLGEEMVIMKNPLLSLGTTLISVIGGYLINWIHVKSGVTKKENI